MSAETLTPEELEAVMQTIEAEVGNPEMAMKAAPTPTSAKTEGAGAMTVTEYVNAAQLAIDVAFNPNDLDDAMVKQASMFVHYANLASLAKMQYDRMKAAFEILESKLDNIHRERMKADGAKVTEAQIAAAVKTDPRWWQAQQRLIRAKGIADLAANAREAFSQRRDMLIQMGSDRRNERSGQLRIMEGQRQVDHARADVMEHLKGRYGS